jgi:hypothetical protein
MPALQHPRLLDLRAVLGSFVSLDLSCFFPVFFIDSISARFQSHVVVKVPNPLYSPIDSCSFRLYCGVHCLSNICCSLSVRSSSSQPEEWKQYQFSSNVVSILLISLLIFSSFHYSCSSTRLNNQCKKEICVKDPYD